MSKPLTSKSIDVPENLFKELLTESELRMVKQRFYIIKLLEEGLSIRKIAERAKVGTDTVVRVAKMRSQKNLSKLLKPEPKLGDKIKSSTPWIFGKSD